MKDFSKILFLVFFLLLLTQTITVNAQTEDCYLPVRPPTIEDKKNFIEQISKLAVEAEKKHGVPASAIAGMAILESGYGLTRLSMDANNIFGYKKVAGQITYTLTCQPTWDVGNEYVKFNSWAEAMDFVASRLAASQYYRADTAKYKAEITSGTDRKTAAINWLAGISNPYNYAPTEYVNKVKKCINNPYNWSEQVDENTNLWKLSPTNESQTNNQQKLGQVKQILNDLIVGGGRYMEGSCKDLSSSSSDNALDQILKPYFDYLSEKNLSFKIEDCTYQQELKGRVIMLNVDADQLARWTVSACQPNVTDACLNAVIHNVWLANNAQFPITGTVTEPASICGQGAGEALFAFRDGVTVALNSFRPANGGATCTKSQLTDSQLEAVLAEPVVRNGKFVRIANGIGTGTNVSKYLSNARKSYLEALGADEYKLLKSWVVENRQTNQFSRLKNVPLGKINSKCWYANSANDIKKYCP